MYETVSCVLKKFGEHELNDVKSSICSINCVCVCVLANFKQIFCCITFSPRFPCIFPHMIIYCCFVSFVSFVSASKLILKQSKDTKKHSQGTELAALESSWVFEQPFADGTRVHLVLETVGDIVDKLRRRSHQRGKRR